MSERKSSHNIIPPESPKMGDFEELLIEITSMHK
jgi:hypothetical protein